MNKLCCMYVVLEVTFKVASSLTLRTMDCFHSQLFLPIIIFYVDTCHSLNVVLEFIAEVTSAWRLALWTGHNHSCFFVIIIITYLYFKVERAWVMCSKFPIRTRFAWKLLGTCFLSQWEEMYTVWNECQVWRVLDTVLICQFV